MRLSRFFLEKKDLFIFLNLGMEGMIELKMPYQLMMRLQFMLLRLII